MTKPPKKTQAAPPTPPPESDKHPGGRPLKFKTAEDLQMVIDLYFDKCDKEYDTRKFAHEAIVRNEKNEAVCMNCGLPGWRRGCLVTEGEKKTRTPYTVSGLAIALGTSRQTLLEYEGEVEGREKSPEFADAIKAAKTRCENYLEVHGLYGDMAPAKAIFGLTNFDGWKNKQNLSHGGDPDAPPIPFSLGGIITKADGQ